MAQLDNKIYRIVTPDSQSNIIYEEYEYMLGWYNRQGVPVQWLFTDWENMQAVRATPINIKDSSRLESIIDEEDRRLKFVAEDLTRGERELFESLLVAKTIYRIYRVDSAIYTPGGYEKLGNLGGRIQWGQSKQRFKVEFELQQFEPTLWR